MFPNNEVAGHSYIKTLRHAGKMHYKPTRIYTYSVSLLQTNTKRHKHSGYMQPDTHTDQLICTPHAQRNSYVGSSLHLKNDYSADTPASALCVRMELGAGGCCRKGAHANRRDKKVKTKPRNIIFKLKILIQPQRMSTLYVPSYLPGRR